MNHDTASPEKQTRSKSGNWPKVFTRGTARIQYFHFTKILKTYLITRFSRLIFLWAAIFLTAFAVNMAVTKLSPKPCGPVIVPADLEHYAESNLLLILFLGTMVVLMLHRLTMRMVTLNEAQSDWGESAIDAVMDEISAAATHFACILIWVSIYTAFSFKSTWSREGVFSIAISIILAVYTFDAKANYPDFDKPIKEEYEATLQTENTKETIEHESKVSFLGTLYKHPPRGYETWLVRRWEVDGKPMDVFHPVAELKLEEKSSVEVAFATTATIWGDIGNFRFFEVWIVGPQGKAVFDAWANGNERFSNLREISGKFNHLYPGLTCRTSDMVTVFDGLKLKIVPREDRKTENTELTASRVLGDPTPESPANK
jgi:hypothetical protein